MTNLEFARRLAGIISRLSNKQFEALVSSDDEVPGDLARRTCIDLNHASENLIHDLGVTLPKIQWPQPTNTSNTITTHHFNAKGELIEHDQP